MGLGRVLFKGLGRFGVWVWLSLGLLWLEWKRGFWVVFKVRLGKNGNVLIYVKLTGTILPEWRYLT